MIVLCGPSASGKTEVSKLLKEKYGINKVVTTTTRKPRKDEKDGRDYFFVTKKEFEKLIHNDKLVEYTEYNGHYYGSQKDQIDVDKCIIVDPQGLKKYSDIKRKRIVTFYLETSEALRYERMLLRGDHKEDALKRLENDKIAFDKSNLPKVDFVIESEDNPLEEIVEKIYTSYKRHLKGR